MAQRSVPDQFVTSMSHYDYVSFEQTIPEKYRQPAPRPDVSPQERINLANQYARELKEVLVQSVNSPDRYPVGEHSFLESDFAARTLLEPRLLERAEGERRVTVPDNLAAEIGPDAAEALARLSLHELVNTPASRLASRVRVPARALAALKLAQGGVPLMTPEERRERARAALEEHDGKEGA